MDRDQDLLGKLELTFASLEACTSEKRVDFINKFLSMCSPADLAQINMKLEELKRDFICMLPVEVVEVILKYLDWKSLLNCCQVNSKWNRTISNDFNRLWFKLCVDVLPCNKDKAHFLESMNYKSRFLELLQNSKSLESGKLFRNWSVGPTEVNSLAIYKDIVATSTHVVRFWKLTEVGLGETKTSFPNQFVNDEDANYEWVNFKSFDLMSRVLLMRFDDKYLVTTNYFLTVEVYSIETERCIQQCSGHTCQITCFDFNQDLMLIVTGSADYTLKYWSIETGADSEANSNNCQISSETNTVWPVCIQIVKYTEDVYFVLRLSTQGSLFINSVEKIADFQSDVGGNASDGLDSFNFKAKLLFSSKICVELDAQFKFLDCDNEWDYLPVSHKSYLSFCDKTLVAYMVTDNNPRQKTKAYVTKWCLDSSDPNKLAFIKADDVSDDYKFLNERHLALMGINRYEIIAFGLCFSLFVDDDDHIYLCNLRTRKITCLQRELNIHTDKLRIFQLSTNVQEQFVLGDRSWLDGYRLQDMDSSQSIHENKSFVFSFFTHRINEVFCVLWNV